MSIRKLSFTVPHAQRNILTGVLILTPILVTWIVFDFLFEQLAIIGKPWVTVIFRTIYRFSPELAEWLFTPWVEYAIAVALSHLPRDNAYKIDNLLC